MQLVLRTEEIQMVGIVGLGNSIGNSDDPVSEPVDLGEGPDHVPVGTLDLVGEAGRSKEVLDGIGLKPLDLDEPLLDKTLQEEIDRTKGHANVLGELPLRCFRVLVDVVENR